MPRLNAIINEVLIKPYDFQWNLSGILIYRKYSYDAKSPTFRLLINYIFNFSLYFCPLNFSTGQGDMAVANSIGSNVFDILIGLALPWFLQTCLLHPGTMVWCTCICNDFVVVFSFCRMAYFVVMHIMKCLNVMLSNFFKQYGKIFQKVIDELLSKRRKSCCFL